MKLNAMEWAGGLLTLAGLASRHLGPATEYAPVILTVGITALCIGVIVSEVSEPY